MYIKHPKDNSLINTEFYADIRCCTVNVTHVDFYKEALPAGKRGSPDLTVILDTEKDRTTWFKKIEKALCK